MFCRLLHIMMFAFASGALPVVAQSDQTTVEINGNVVPPSHGSVTGTWFYHAGETQLLLLGHGTKRIVAALQANDTITLRSNGKILFQFKAESETKTVDLPAELFPEPERRPWSLDPVETSPEFHPAIETALIEHDWRMQDGIDTPKEAKTFRQAIEKILPRIERLLVDFETQNVGAVDLSKRFQEMKNRTDFDRSHWLELHRLRREIVLANPLFETGPLLFAKQVPSTMSHQLTQAYGYTARPGGGLFVLEKPGRSMKLRSLSDDKFPRGSFSHPETGFDGDKIIFAFCPAEKSPEKWQDPTVRDRRYHLYEMNRDGTGVRQLTDGPFDDFNPTPLPDGSMICVSTRRGGFHRCGLGPCYVYTLAKFDPRVDNAPKPISFHETNEWDPCVLHDGRILYTRWDYVDRDAIFYQQLWTVRQDGTNVRIFYGNNSYVPCGTWESRPIPGSEKIMATAAPHHGMTAGSIILVDPTRGVDGDEPINRLTPEVRFPEVESLLAHGIWMPEPTDFDSPVKAYWDSVHRTDRPGKRIGEATEEERRWPGHCYKSPWPLSETYFIASYSYDLLRGEPGPNIPNMFGLYFVDAFGNKELIYRDPNISSVWAKPMTPRPLPPVTHGAVERDSATGTFYLQNVYESWPYKLPEDGESKIKSLRIVQVLPKTTPNIDQPPVGRGQGAPGKQVLGTVPVEEDGSAHFEVPAKTPILFQALDAKGRAVQTMRSLTYLQPGETMSCIGCHENRMQTFSSNTTSLAMKRNPSTITPGPDGSRPFSFPILVQPVLDRHCVSCHAADKTEKEHAGIILTGEPEGKFSRSYNTLVNRVAYSAWGMPHGNYEPITEPDRFGARASSLVKLLEAGHYDIKLSEDDWNRINTWIDANALFYGTFDPADQQRQLRGERIEAPKLE